MYYLLNFLGLFFIFSCTSVQAGLNNFTDLIFVEEWLIERKIDLTFNEIECRASIPSHANWFGARVRLGPNNELIKPSLQLAVLISKSPLSTSYDLVGHNPQNRKAIELLIKDPLAPPTSAGVM